jgi:hypothetical protein
MGDQNVLSQAPPCFGRQIKSLATAAYAVVVSPHHGGLLPVLLMCNPSGKPVLQQ